MEIHFPPELEAKLNEISLTTGRPKDGLVQDATASYLEDLTQVRRSIDGRYDDIKSERMRPIDGEEAFAILRRKGDERRSERS